MSILQHCWLPPSLSVHALGLLPPALQMDNTSKENKNGFMLAFYSWLAGIKRFKSINVNFFRWGLGIGLLFWPKEHAIKPDNVWVGR